MRSSFRAIDKTSDSRCKILLMKYSVNENINESYNLYYVK